MPTTPRGRAKVKRVMREHKQGTLRSSSGKTPSRKQAIAIALNEGRKVEQKGRRTR